MDIEMINTFVNDTMKQKIEWPIAKNIATDEFYDNSRRQIERLLGDNLKNCSDDVVYQIAVKIWQNLRGGN